MKPIFGRGPSLQLRLVIAVVCSVALILADRNLPQVSHLKFVLSSAVSPLQYVANAPQDMLNWAAESLHSRRTLIDDNKRLRLQHLHDRSELQLMEQLRQENNRLRALLGSAERKEARKLVTEVFSVSTDNYSQQVVIDKGSFDNVYVGQPVLDHEGVVGQVTHVGPTTSRVLLISDLMHAIPVRNSRNDIRAIASGTGDISALELQHVPHSADIRKGDLLIASGLGGRFPEGYPVARVTRFDPDESLPFARVEAESTAKLDRIRYLLLLWPEDAPEQPRQESVR